MSEDKPLLTEMMRPLSVATVSSIAPTCRRMVSSSPGRVDPAMPISSAIVSESARCSRMRTSSAERDSTSASSRLVRISTLNQLSMPLLRNCTAKKYTSRIGSVASTPKIQTMRALSREPITWPRQSRISWVSLVASRPTSTTRPATLIARIHGCRRLNCSEFCAVCAMNRMAASHSRPPRPIVTAEAARFRVGASMSSSRSRRSSRRSRTTASRRRRVRCSCRARRGSVLRRPARRPRAPCRAPASRGVR